MLDKEWPWLRRMHWNLVLIPVPGLKTMATDEYWRVYYDPKVDERWAAENNCAVIAHEEGHIIAKHCTRLKDFENVVRIGHASDLEINARQLKEGFKLPDKPLVAGMQGQRFDSPYTSLPEGLSAEKYYDLLEPWFPEQPEPDGSEQQQGEQQGPSQGQPQEGRQGQQSQQQGEQEADENGTLGKQEPGRSEANQAGGMPGAGGGGSASHGHQMPWELAPPSADGPPGVDRAQREILLDAVAKDIKDSPAMGRGNAPAWARKWADDRLTTKVPWETQLRNAVNVSIASVAEPDDYTYSRPSRYQSVLPDILMPATVGYGPRTAVIFDTSGSMGNMEQGQTLAELAGILRASGQQDEGVMVYVGDTEVTFARNVFNRNQVELIGGGGTDMTPHLEAAMAQRPSPDIVIVLSDCMSAWPAEQPRGAQIIIVRLTLEGRGPAGEHWMPKWDKYKLIDVEVPRGESYY